MRAEDLDPALLDDDVRAGLEVAITNVALVADAGVGDDVEVALPQGHRVVLREVPVARAAIYVPGGRAPYPSSLVMGVVTARAAGVEEVVVLTPPEIAPVIRGTCALCGVSEVYAMGGAHGIAALAFGTETIPRVDVIAGPGSLIVQEAKRQVCGSVGIDGFYGPSDVAVLADATADARLVALDLLAQGEHGPGAPVVAVSDSAQWLDELRGAARGAAARAAGTRIPRRSCSRTPTRCATGSRSPRRSRPSTSSSSARCRAPRAPRARAGCVFVGAQRRDGVRRLRRGFEPLAADRRLGALRIRPVAAAFSPPFQRGARRQRRPPALAAAGAPIARAEGFVVHAESMEARIEENRRHEPLRRARPRDQGDADPPVAGAGRRGPRRAQDGRRLPRPHARPARAPRAASTSTSPRPATCTPARTTPSRTSGSSSARRSTPRSATAAGIFRYGHAVVPMDEARALCAIDISGRPYCAVDAPGLRRRRDRRLRARAARGVLPRRRQQRAHDVHIDVQAGTNAHHIIEVSFKAFARALRAAIAIDPTETGVPSTKGTLTA